MICPKCKFEQKEQNNECPKCGLIFEKYEQHQVSNSQTKATIVLRTDKQIGIAGFIQKWFFYVSPEINPFFFVVSHNEKEELT